MFGVIQRRIGELFGESPWRAPALRYRPGSRCPSPDPASWHDGPRRSVIRLATDSAVANPGRLLADITTAESFTISGGRQTDCIPEGRPEAFHRSVPAGLGNAGRALVGALQQLPCPVQSFLLQPGLGR